MHIDHIAVIAFYGCVHANSIDCGIVLPTVRTVASDEHPLEILLESASEGRMAKLILRDNLTGSIDVSSHCVLSIVYWIILILII